MKITLINSWRQLLSKKINILWIVLALAGVIGGYVYLANFKIPFPNFIIKQIVSADHYLLYLIAILLVGTLVYRSTTVAMNFNVMQRFTMGIKRWKITLLVMVITLGMEVIIVGAPILKLHNELKVIDYEYIFSILFLSNLINYAFSKNILGKLLTIIALVITKFTYTTKYGVYIYALIAVITFLVTFITEDTFYLNINKKMSFAFLVKNKFVESVIYMFRCTKSISIYLLFVLLIIYTSLPDNLKIHYKIGPADINSFIFALFGFALFYISVSGLIFTRVKNFYTQKYNNNLYVNFFIFNVIYFVILAFVSSWATVKGWDNVFHDFAMKLQTIVAFLLGSVIIQKRTLWSVVLCFIINALMAEFIFKHIPSSLLQNLVNLGIITLTLILEIINAKKNQIKDFN